MAGRINEEDIATVRDRARIDDARDSLVAVAEATGCRAVIVETNLREHPVGVQMDWERGHGGALRDIAHIFDDAEGDRGRGQRLTVAVGGEGVEEGVGGGVVGLAFLADEAGDGR